MQSVLDGVNYPELPTIYAPVTQLAFLLAYWIKPASVLALQAILIAVDLGVVFLLLRLAPSRNVLLYAWCPLVVKEIAFTAHPDGIGVCLLLGAVVLARNRRWAGGGALLGLAVATKTFAIVIAPIVLLRARFRHWLLCAATVAAVYLPFAVHGGADLFSLGVFARAWEFNSALFGLVKQVVPPSGARVLLGLLFAAFWVWYCRRRVRRDEREAAPRGDPAVRRSARRFPRDQPVVPALAAAVRGTLPECLGMDGLACRLAQLRHRPEPARLHVAAVRSAPVGARPGVRPDPLGGRC